MDTELFDPRRRNEELRRSWGCPPAGPVALHVGRLAAEKNLELALEAFRAISASTPDAKLVPVGDGPKRQRLHHTYPDLVMPGVKVGVEFAEHYASGDLFLSPSLTETFGNVVLEAMASGLPVIAFDYAAAGTCIRSRENGIRVPMRDADAFIAAAATAFADSKLDPEDRILRPSRMRRRAPAPNPGTRPCWQTACSNSTRQSRARVAPATRTLPDRLVTPGAACDGHVRGAGGDGASGDISNRWPRHPSIPSCKPKRPSHGTNVPCRHFAADGSLLPRPQYSLLAPDMGASHPSSILPRSSLPTLS